MKAMLRATSQWQSRQWGIAALVVAGGVGVGAWLWNHWGIEETDNAQLQAHLVEISSRVPGTISAVAVQDNQTVRAGQWLVALDPRDSQAALRLAQADWVEAKSQAQAMAAQASAMASYQQAKGQLTRSRASREQAFASRSQVGVDQQKAVAAQAKIQQSAASLASAQLQLAYTQIKAPVAGRVGGRFAEVGRQVLPG